MEKSGQSSQCGKRGQAAQAVMKTNDKAGLCDVGAVWHADCHQVWTNKLGLASEEIC